MASWTTAGSLLALGAAMALSSTARADHHDLPPGHDHGQHVTGPSAATQELSEASKAFEEAAQRMHQGMSQPYTNDVDVDFVRGMIPHHQGAIEQAQILLKYSKNPRLRRLAGGIIAAQRREIRFMEKWLNEHAKGVKSEDMPDWLKNAPTDDTSAGEALPKN